MSYGTISVDAATSQYVSLRSSQTPSFSKSPSREKNWKNGEYAGSQCGESKGKNIFMCILCRRWFNVSVIA